jgi:hypothetical protein
MFIKENTENSETFFDALANAQREFKKDPEVIKAYEIIKKKHDEIVEKEFSKIDPEWSDNAEFGDFSEGYYSDQKKEDPNERSLFDYVWFNQ